MKSQPSASRLNPQVGYRFVALLVFILAILLVTFNASKPGGVVEGCPQGCNTASARLAGPFRVVSLNMLHGIPWFVDLDTRVSLITAEIKRLDADVALLQEVPWRRTAGSTAEALADALGYNHIYLRANGNRGLIGFEEGEAILSRFPLEDIVFKQLTPAVDIFQHRVVLGATARTPWGELRLFSTHLTHSDPQVNDLQVRDLEEFVEAHTPGMGVVGGDFNAWEDTAQMQDLASTWTDTYRIAHPGDNGLTCCTDDLKAPPGVPLQMRIDYIFLVHMNWKLVSAEHAFYAPFQVRNGWQWASDHTGLLVEIEP